jgi:hypothetical protein
VTPGRICASCDADIGHRRRDARFCERAACRQADSRRARAAVDEALILERARVVLALMRAGEIDAHEGLALVVWPPPGVLEAFRAAA